MILSTLLRSFLKCQGAVTVLGRNAGMRQCSRQPLVKTDALGFQVIRAGHSGQGHPRPGLCHRESGGNSVVEVPGGAAGGFVRDERLRRRVAVPRLQGQAASLSGPCVYSERPVLGERLRAVPGLAVAGGDDRGERRRAPVSLWGRTLLGQRHPARGLMLDVRIPGLAPSGRRIHTHALEKGRVRFSPVWAEPA